MLDDGPGGKAITETNLTEIKRGGCSRFGSQNLGLGFKMPSELKRYFSKGHFHFIKFSCCWHGDAEESSGLKPAHNWSINCRS